MMSKDKKGIFSATFEESVNLEDNSLIKYMEEDTRKRGLYMGRQNFVLVLLWIFLVSIIYLLSFLTQQAVTYGVKDSPVPQPKVNLLPMWFFWLCLTIWLIIWVITKIKRFQATRPYFTQLNTNNYLVWLIIVVNLFFMTFCAIPLGILGVLGLITLIIFPSYLVVIAGIRNLNQQLFQLEKENKIDTLISRLISYIIKYGGGIVAIYMVWKILFSSFFGEQTQPIGFIGIIVLLIISDFAIVASEMYLFCPYLLQAYYKYKYSEDYRKWEGKTQVEWYGEKYFNKHIKGTEKEEKDDRRENFKVSL